MLAVVVAEDQSVVAAGNLIDLRSQEEVVLDL